MVTLKMTPFDALDCQEYQGAEYFQDYSPPMICRDLPFTPDGEIYPVLTDSADTDYSVVMIHDLNGYYLNVYDHAGNCVAVYEFNDHRVEISLPLTHDDLLADAWSWRQ